MNFSPCVGPVCRNMARHSVGLQCPDPASARCFNFPLDVRLLMFDDMEAMKIPDSLRQQLSRAGKSASKEQKSKAGKLSWAARLKQAKEAEKDLKTNTGENK